MGERADSGQRTSREETGTARTEGSSRRGGTRPPLRSRWVTWTWVAALVSVSCVLLWPLRSIGLTGDDFEHLLQVQRGWWDAATKPLSYHYIPVGLLALKTVASIAGTTASAWALVNGLLLVAAALGVLWLSVRLFRDPLSGFFAGCLVVGSAAFPEVTFWPTVGSVFSLAGLQYTVALGLGNRLGDETVPGWVPAGFALATAGACFTYPGAVTVLPVVWLWTSAVLLRRRLRAGTDLARFARALLIRLGPSVPVLCAIAFARSRFTKELAAATELGFGPERLRYLAEGIVSTFSVQGDRRVLHALVTAGLTNDGGSQVARVASMLVVGLAATLGGWVVVRRFPRGEAFLALVLLVHFPVMALWVPIAPRHCFLPSCVALLLVVRGCRHLGRRLEQRWRPRPSLFRRAVPAFVTFALLIASRGSFVRAADLWSRSASVSDKLLSLVTEARAAQPGLERVVTIDLPSYLTDGGFTVPFGSYNLPKLLALRSPGLLVDRFRLRPERPGQIWGARIAPLSARAVHALVLDRTRLVLRYDSGPGVLHRLDPAGHVPATALTRDRTPELAWREGAWPWLLVTSEDALDVPMAIPAGGWLALRFLSGPSTSLLLSVDDSPPRGVGPDHTRPPCWTTLTKAAPEPHAAASLDLHSVRLESKDPLAIAGIWSFRPQSRYSPESSPYLGWLGDGPDRFFEVAGELDLPLVLPGGGTARRTEVLVRVLLSAENVGELRLDDQTFALGGPENGPPRWTTIRLIPRAGSTGLLTIRRTGQAPVRVGVVEVK